MSARTRTVLLRVLLVAYLLVVLRLTLWPRLGDEPAFDWLDSVLAWAHAHGLPQAIGVPVVEAVANVVMFVPFGLLVPPVTGVRLRVAVLLGAGSSALIELSQLAFLPERVPTLQDVAMNTLGAATGVALLALLARRTAARTARTARTAVAGGQDAAGDTASPTDGAEKPDEAARAAR